MTAVMKDKVALITGAAGAIGRAMMASFATESASLCLCDCDEERLREVAESCAKKHGQDRVFSQVVDVSRPSQVRDFVKAAAETFKRIGVLVNNAAITVIVKIDETTDEQIDSIIDTNLKEYFYFAREVVGIMKESGGGSTLMLSSKNGLFGPSEKSHYSATKAAELWERGGPYSKATAERYGITEDAIPDYYRNRCDLKINITPQDVANAALFLATDQSRATTGAIITVDGGVAYVR